MKKLFDAVTWVVLIVGFGLVLVYHLEVSRWLDQNVNPVAKTWLTTHQSQISMAVLGFVLIWLAVSGLNRGLWRRADCRKIARHGCQVIQTWRRAKI